MRGQGRPAAQIHLDQGQAHLRPELAEQSRRHEEQRRHAHHHESVGGRPRLVPMQCHQPVWHGLVVRLASPHGRALAVSLLVALEDSAR